MRTGAAPGGPANSGPWDREQVAENHDVVPIVSEPVMAQKPCDGLDILPGQLLSLCGEGTGAWPGRCAFP